MELRGQQIPGSKYFRDFCARCGAAMRVTSNRIGDGMWCEDCNPPLIRNKPLILDDDNPWQQIAIRAMEEL
jgi:DNA-directed RNA polymerase subunit RPC12/RpoP